MKVSAQEKIAELESRIVELEQLCARLASRISKLENGEAPSVTFVPTDDFWSHWHKLWNEFDLVMKSAFKRIRP